MDHGFAMAVGEDGDGPDWAVTARSGGGVVRVSRAGCRVYASELSPSAIAFEEISICHFHRIGCSGISEYVAAMET